MINLRYEKSLSQEAMDAIAEAGLKSDDTILWDLAKTVATLLGTDTGNVHVTTGQVENMALIMHSIYYYNDAPRVIGSFLDDSSLFTGPAPGDMSFDICPVDRQGRVIKEEYTKLLGNKPALAIVTAVNEETGVISDVTWMADKAKAAGAIVALDAAHAARFTDISSIPDTIDIVSLDSGCLGGPSGIGCLWVRDGVRIAPFFTSANPFLSFNATGAAAMTGTLKDVLSAREREVRRITTIRDKMDMYMKGIDGVTVNCETTPRSCHITNYHIKDVNAYTLHLILKKMDIHIGYGPEGYALINLPSPLSVALHGKENAGSNIVVKLGNGVPVEEAMYTVRTIKKVYEELRNSPEKAERKGETK
jgi:cysteine desulfurase